jgi:uncharacterized membrane protein
MNKYLAGYAATLVVMVALDMLWLGLIAKPLYQQGIGHLMAEKPNLVAAAMFYLLFALGLMVFAVSAQAGTQGWGRTVGAAALFGLIAYATYDLSNLATLKQWPVGLSLLDMGWGSTASAIAAAAGRLAWQRVGAG